MRKSTMSALAVVAGAVLLVWFLLRRSSGATGALPPSTASTASGGIAGALSGAGQLGTGLANLWTAVSGSFSSDSGSSGSGSPSGGVSM